MRTFLRVEGLEAHLLQILGQLVFGGDLVEGHAVVFLHEDFL